MSLNWLETNKKVRVGPKKFGSVGKPETNIFFLGLTRLIKIYFTIPNPVSRTHTKILGVFRDRQGED